MNGSSSRRSLYLSALAVILGLAGGGAAWLSLRRVGWIGLLCIGAYSHEARAQGIPAIPGVGAGAAPGAASALGGAAVAPQVVTVLHNDAL